MKGTAITRTVVLDTTKASLTVKHAKAKTKARASAKSAKKPKSKPKPKPKKSSGKHT